MSVARQMSPTQVPKWLSMGKGCVPSWIRCGVVSPLSFTDNIGIRYFDQAWLRKAMDLVGGKRGNMN